MEKAGQIRHCKGLEKPGRHVVAMRNLPVMLLSIVFVSKTGSFVPERELAVTQNIHSILLFLRLWLGEAGLTDILNFNITG